MNESDTGPDQMPDQAVERGETYDHEQYGRVKVTGIWEGVHHVDSAHNTSDGDIIIVRYSTKQDGKQIDDLADLLPEFLEAIQ